MKRSRALIAAAALAWAFVPASAAQPAKLLEPFFLGHSVAAGDLPPVRERVPETPSIVTLNGTGQSPGRYGGDLRLLMGKPKDVRMMMVYGYARLVAYDTRLEIVPDILERLDVREGREFTLRLRKGHRWSDGQPFTAEDFRYYWEDVAGNAELSPFGLTKVLLIDGMPPRFEVLDKTTVRYTWSRPNPYFVPALAAAAPLFIYRPAHYLKRFHVRYADPATLRRQVRKAGMRNWAGLHDSKDRQYRSDNPRLPTLQPWVNMTRPPSERFIFTRNPYYYRIDTAGRQLPYIDRVIITLGSNKMIPAKTGAGDADLQARYLRFDNYTFLKEGEKRNGFTVRLWRTAKGAQKALYPNLNAADPVWRAVLRDVRFRRALSLAINRHEINQVVYFGLARESANTVLPESPLYREQYQTAWSQFDVERANALLDDMGLTKRTSDGIRLLPDGRPLNIIVDTAGESTEETDILELIHDSWLKAGIKLYSKPAQREVFRKRIFAGQTVMSVWAGLANGLPAPDMSPEELAPTAKYQLHWPKWGQYAETGGRAGEPPDMAPARELVRLNTAWRGATSGAERERIWRRILDIHAEQVFTIGIVNGTLQPVVINNRLRNVPAEGIYAWNPGAYFGIYKPDTFWFARKSGK
jgi:peptide/nickel transport system substrate-binding protein